MARDIRSPRPEGIKEPLGNFGPGSQSMKGCFLDIPDGQLAIEAPHGKTSLMGDHLRRNQVQIFARAEVGVDVLSTENRKHDVATSSAHSPL